MCPLLTEEERKKNREFRAGLFKSDDAPRKHHPIEERLSRSEKGKEIASESQAWLENRDTSHDSRRKTVWKRIEPTRVYGTGSSRDVYSTHYGENKKRKVYEFESQNDRYPRKDRDKGAYYYNSHYHQVTYAGNSRYKRSSYYNTRDYQPRWTQRSLDGNRSRGQNHQAEDFGTSKHLVGKDKSIWMPKEKQNQSPPRLQLGESS